MKRVCGAVGLLLSLWLRLGGATCSKRNDAGRDPLYMRFFTQSVRFSFAFPCVHALTYGPDGLTQTHFNLGEGKHTWPGSARHEIRKCGFTNTAVAGNFVNTCQFGGGAHEVFQPKDGLADAFVCEVTDFVCGPVWVELAGRGLFCGHVLTVGQCWGGFGPRHADDGVAKWWPADSALTVFLTTAIISAKWSLQRPTRATLLTTKGDTPCTAQPSSPRIEPTALRPHKTLTTLDIALHATISRPYSTEPTPLHPATQTGTNAGNSLMPQHLLRGGDTP
ncbi:hypothetical protein FRC0061_00826 [Corynebacterium diphtheriae]|nr:hypothetical protein CIP107515_00856 [Corynebacterium diphtheriae]CAB0688317.1 hypothetical protein FRC0061_00826 [Corynebacterium diphtheriae]CAB0792923.1 hypothetical protein FRC0192_00791 [Corynebacterium diphtheriae]CAB1006092.1 hypothetical protein FRC0521_00795 [Corynebacterium diphtheriae]